MKPGAMDDEGRVALEGIVDEGSLGDLYCPECCDDPDKAEEFPLVFNEENMELRCKVCNSYWELTIYAYVATKGEEK